MQIHNTKLKHDKTQLIYQPVRRLSYVSRLLPPTPSQNSLHSAPSSSSVNTMRSVEDIPSSAGQLYTHTHTHTYRFLSGCKFKFECWHHLQLEIQWSGYMDPVVFVPYLSMSMSKEVEHCTLQLVEPHNLPQPRNTTLQHEFYLTTSQMLEYTPTQRLPTSLPYRLVW